jgi:predicted HicB family RNase H-like nuclease
MNNLKYKGYTGVVEFDGESGVLFGRVIGLRDVITFQGDSVTEVTQAFRDSVDDYLEFCESRSESPEKPFSGNFVLRLDPNLHRAISHAAEAQGASLNALIESTLKRAFGGPGTEVRIDSRTAAYREGETAASLPRQPRPSTANSKNPQSVMPFQSANPKMTVAQAILQAMRAIGPECSISQVKQWISINLNLGNRGVDIGTAMSDLTISSENPNYKPEQKFLERVRRGVYRLSAAFRD